jgi:hypothetical protein
MVFSGVGSFLSDGETLKKLPTPEKIVEPIYLRYGPSARNYIVLEDDGERAKYDDDLRNVIGILSYAALDSLSQGGNLESSKRVGIV